MSKEVYPLYYDGEKQDFSRAIVANGFVFLSGSSGRTLETGEVSSSDVGEQTKVALEKIRLALEEVGSSLENLIKTVIYVTNMRYYDEVRKNEKEYYKAKCSKLLDKPPVSTFVEVVSLSKPDMLVEIDATAEMPK